MSAHTGRAARILRLYTLYTALDTPLVARALGLPVPLVNQTFEHLLARGQVVRQTARLGRRPYSRRLYVHLNSSGGTA